ncbi:MAG: hypothetical protein RLZZ450_568 [Pseudomonadota bacterium]|jgi:hypothetical protein
MSRSQTCAVVLAGLLAGCGADAADAPVSARGSDAGVPIVEDDSFVGCPEAVAPFALGMRRSGDKGRLGAALVGASHAPPLRYLNDWTLTWTRADGAPIGDVVLTKARTFMPVHGHDGIVPPTLVSSVEPGRVEVRGLNFNMRGPWEVQLSLSSPSAGDDYVVFHICVQE